MNKRAFQKDLAFGLPAASPFIEAVWYSKLGKSGLAPERSPIPAPRLPQKRHLHAREIAIAGWILGFIGSILIQVLFWSGETTRLAKLRIQEAAHAEHSDALAADTERGPSFASR